MARTAKAPDLWAASRGFLTVWVAHLGRRYGLLRALAGSKRPLTAASLAKVAGVGPKPAQLWCEAAASVGLIRGSARGYALDRAVARALVESSHPSYVGGHLSYLALRSLDFAAFDELFRDGRPSARPQRHLLQAFTEATPWDHTAFEEVLLRRHEPLRELLRRGADVLDVGAGAGAWEIRTARAFPRSRFVGIEPERAALQAARSAVQRAGLAGRVSFERASGESMDFDARFDLVFLGEVLCAARDPALILRRCLRALRPGGFIVVAEGLIDESRPPSAPGNALVLPMRLEFALQPADFFTKASLRAALKGAGAGPSSLVDAGGGFYFTVARRPGSPARHRPTAGGTARRPPPR